MRHVPAVIPVRCRALLVTMFVQILYNWNAAQFVPISSNSYNYPLDVEFTAENCVSLICICPCFKIFGLLQYTNVPFDGILLFHHRTRVWVTFIDYATGWTVRGWNSGTGNKFVFSWKLPDRLWAYPTCHSLV